MATERKRRKMTLYQEKQLERETIQVELAGSRVKRENEKRVPLCATQLLLLIQLNSTLGNGAKSKAFTAKQKQQTE